MDIKPKILLVDDEEAITSNLAPFLERSGFQTQIAVDGTHALETSAKFTPDLIVLDVLMPKMDGREMLRHMRRGGDWTPVILLTQIGNSSERAMALNEGADDYLNKPFDPQELVARIQTVLRRARPGHPPLNAAVRLSSGDILLDRTARRVWRKGHELALTPKAIALLEYFMTHPDELIPRERLLDEIWGWDYPIGIRVIDSRIAELRKALQEDSTNPQYIETTPGQGYSFIGHVEVAL